MSAVVEYIPPPPGVGTSRSATGLRPRERSTYPVARSGRTRSDRMRSVCSMPKRVEDAVAQVAIQRLAGHVLDDLPERGEPVVAVHPLGPRLDLHRQAPAVVGREGERPRSSRSDARTDARLKQIRQPPPVTDSGGMGEEVPHGGRPTDSAWPGPSRKVRR